MPGWYHVAAGQKVSAVHYNLAIDQGVLAFANAAARDQALATATKHAGMTCYLQDMKKLYSWDGTAWIEVTAPAASGNFLPLTGGTLTGDLVIAKTMPYLNLNTTEAAGGQLSTGVQFLRNGVTRWYLASYGAETGTGNAGSNLIFDPCADNGTETGKMTSISRATGLMTVPGDPTAALGVATKQYVDNKHPTATGVLRMGTSAPAAGGLADGSVYFAY